MQIYYVEGFYCDKISGNNKASCTGSHTKGDSSKYWSLQEYNWDVLKRAKEKDIHWPLEIIRK